MIKVFKFKSVIVIKTIALGVFHVLIMPYILIKPKYENYIFVVTTGRSGSGALANIFKKTKFVHAEHEPYPIMHNNLDLPKKLYKIWNWYLFYFVKYPRILLSRQKGEKTYLETNHLFLKSFSKYATSVFKKKVRIIHLIREPYLVAKSIYEINKIPGEKLGNRWYLNPADVDNQIDFSKGFLSINDKEKNDYKEFYICLWYWYEMEKRFKKFQQTYGNIPIVEITTNELDNTNDLVSKLNTSFTMNIEEIKVKLSENLKNLKKEEKINSIALNEAITKNNLFFKTIKSICNE